jgi:hypothetical protein
MPVSYDKNVHINETAESLCSLYQKDRSTYHSLTSLYTKMSNGADGGQFEPWNPMSLRAYYYKEWTDRDFADVLAIAYAIVSPGENLD